MLPCASKVHMVGSLYAICMCDPASCHAPGWPNAHDNFAHAHDDVTCAHASCTCATDAHMRECQQVSESARLDACPSTLAYWLLHADWNAFSAAVAAIATMVYSLLSVRHQH